MRNITFIVIALICIAITGCNDFKNGEGYLQYKIVDNKNGKLIKRTDFISITITESTAEGKVLNKTNGFNNRPVLMFITHPYFKGDINDALVNLSEGDSAVLKLNIDSLVKRMYIKRPEYTRSKYLVYRVRVNKVITRSTLNDSTFNAAIEKLRADEITKAKKEEPAKINRYIMAKHLQPAVTATNLHYIITKKGTGAGPAAGDSVLVNFKVSDLDGKVFETNIEPEAKAAGIYDARMKYQPFKDVVPARPVSGFQQAFTLLNKEAKATLIVPSSLAYAEFGSAHAEPYTPLLITLEMVEVLPKQFN